MSNETTDGAPMPHYDSRATSTAVASPVQGAASDDRQYMSRDDMQALCAARPAIASGLPLAATSATDQGERYCLACEKAGHRTDECWSTHGLNTPQARELHRLCGAAHELAERAQAARPVAGQAVEWTAHEKGIIADLEVMAGNRNNGFWPQALALGALSMIRRATPAPEQEALIYFDDSEPVIAPHKPAKLDQDWDAPEQEAAPNELAEIERRAKAIYEMLPGSEAHPWVERGNSHMQDKARGLAIATRHLPAPAPVEQEAAPLDPAFIADLARSRAKHPGNAKMLDGLCGELHELKRAYNGDGDVRAEAFDVAVVAYRLAVEGDSGGNRKLDLIPDSLAWGAAQ